MNTAVLFSSAKDDWQTPREFFAQLDAEFRFDCDVAASRENRMVPQYLGPGSLFAEDALDWFKWHEDFRTCWCNPPYSRGLQGKFIAKAAEERRKGVTTVMLLPARTDTKAFHRYIWNRHEHGPKDGVEVRFLPGRIKFVGAKHGAPFPSMIVVFRP